MKALVLEGVQNLHVRDVEDPRPAPLGALIRVMANGVCRSDWHAWTGDFKRDYPTIMGHEITGVVEEVAEGVRAFRKGDRVLVPFTGSEGGCPHCLAGATHLCDTPHIPGKTYPGGYAELVAVPQADRNLVHLPDPVSFVDGAALGCRFMTSFHGLVDQAALGPGEWVAIFGCGGVGLSAINIATAIGARVIGIDINPGNLDLARRMGAAFCIDSREADPVEAVMEMTGGGAHVAVDALGIGATCVAAVSCLRKRGRHVQIGITGKADAGHVRIPIDLIAYKELRLIGAHGMAAHRFPALLPMVAEGRLAPGRMVGAEISLSQVESVFEGMNGSTNVGTFVVTSFA